MGPTDKLKASISAPDVLRQCRTYVFDCDGVLWHENHLLPGAVDLINYLLETDRHVFLITNNSTKSVEQYAEKCYRLGLPVSEESIICSSNVAATYLKSKGISGPIYVLGHDGVGLELDKCGITHFGIGPDHPLNSDPLDGIRLDPNTSGVLVGFDGHFNYRKLLKATSYISRGVPFFATNEDAQLPAGDTVLPGTGAIVAAVKFASGKDPIVMGKPHRPTFDLLCKLHNIEVEKTIMVGDRLDTDILFGNRFRMHTACVMTGVTDAELLSKVQTDPTAVELRPSLTFQSVEELFETLRLAERC
ncbi:Phosphoglycolate phosphatase [Paragonimus heterotremus]|uniref:Phosphoglycolate phosphatase n=1 Tax=Paragonimus heterotremus TaxID=100268 RepID=A0A8J4WZM5_9TREM|nr:Phosphoglycolate phosphatase [Paragonimus heterotremus]